MSSHYETLGVAKNADAADIKRAYRRKSRKVHPDRGGDHNAMIAVNRAYKTLSDPEKRAYYDSTGQDQPSETPLDVKVRAILMQLFLSALDQASDQHDVIELMRDQIRKNQADAINKVAELRTKAAVLEQRRKRLRYKGTDRNFLLDVLEQQIGAMKEGAARMETESKAIGDRALELLKDFSYHPEFVQQIFTVIFTTGTGSGR